MTDTHIPHNLDNIFEALANKHRREIIYVLGLQPYSIKQLAALRNLSLPAMHKHITILEKANMIIRKKIGRENILTLNTEAIRVLQDWLMQYHAYWGSNKASLDNYVQFFTKVKTGKEVKK